MLSNNKQLFFVVIAIIITFGVFKFFSNNNKVSNNFLPSLSNNQNPASTSPTYNFNPQESPKVNFPSVAYASDIKKNTSVYNPNGEIIKADINVTQDGNGTSIEVKKPQQFVPGKYTLIINMNGKRISQDFTWGVLAINPNKSIYTPGETALLALAVLDDKGKMVCDADVRLSIKDATGKISTATSKDKTIIVNKECKLKSLTVNPDYETTYKVGPIGTYEMDLTATSSKGTHNIVDFFQVQSSVDFDIERVTATRIFPFSIYPVVLKITANKDFEGEITDIIPNSFKITPVENVVQYKTIENKNGNLYIKWNLSIKKGQKINLGYNFKAPLISPQFYLMGPLSMTSGGTTVFEEKRTWQLAIDDINYSSTILGTSGLIGYWRLGEPSGTSAVDSSTAGHNGTYVLSPTLGVAGTIQGDSDTAVTFNGTTQDVTVASVADFSPGSVTGPVSFEVWFKRSTATADNGLIARPGAAGARWFLYVSSGFSCSPTPVGTIVWGGGSTAVTCSNTQITDNNWHYLVATYDGTASGWKIYIDGIDDGFAVHTDGTVPTTNTGTVTFAQDLASDFWHGSLDEIAIYNVALTPAQILNHYNLGIATSLGITYVSQAQTGAGSGTTLTATIPALNSGDQVIVGLSSSNGAITTPDSIGGTWQQALSFTNNDFNKIYVNVAPTAGTTSIVGNFGGSGDHMMSVLVVRGLDTTNPIGPTSTGTGTSTTPDPGSVTPLQANNIVVAQTYTGTTFSSGANNGFTNLHYALGSPRSLGMAFKIQSTATAADPTWTYGSASNWDALNVVFNGAAAVTGETLFRGVQLKGVQVH